MRDAARSEQLEDARGSRRIELGERVIEQDEWRTPGATKYSGLEQTKRDRCSPLLPRRAERAQLVAVERKLKVIAVRPHVREPAP